MMFRSREDGLLERMKRDFDRIALHAPESCDCTILLSVGDGKSPETVCGSSARCVCYAKGGTGKPIIRTSLDNPIERGMLIWIPEQGENYLLMDRPQKEPNCYATTGTRCNKDITFIEHIPAQTDDDGMLIREACTWDVVRDLPCVVTDSIAYSYGQNMPGMVAESFVDIHTQLNGWTREIPLEAEFVMGGQTYRVLDRRFEGNAEEIDPQRVKGILRLKCARIAGGAK